MLEMLLAEKLMEHPVTGWSMELLPKGETPGRLRLQRPRCSTLMDCKEFNKPLICVYEWGTIWRFSII